MNPKDINANNQLLKISTLKSEVSFFHKEKIELLEEKSLLGKRLKDLEANQINITMEMEQSNREITDFVVKNGQLEDMVKSQQEHQNQQTNTAEEQKADFDIEKNLFEKDKVDLNARKEYIEKREENLEILLKKIELNNKRILVMEDSQDSKVRKIVEIENENHELLKMKFLNEELVTKVNQLKDKVKFYINQNSNSEPNMFIDDQNKDGFGSELIISEQGIPKIAQNFSIGFGSDRQISDCNIQGTKNYSNFWTSNENIQSITKNIIGIDRPSVNSVVDPITLKRFDSVINNAKSDLDHMYKQTQTNFEKTLGNNDHLSDKKTSKKKVGKVAKVAIKKEPKIPSKKTDDKKQTINSKKNLK